MLDSKTVTTYPFANAYKRLQVLKFTYLSGLF